MTETQLRQQQLVCFTNGVNINTNTLHLHLLQFKTIIQAIFDEDYHSCDNSVQHLSNDVKQFFVALNNLGPLEFYDTQTRDSKFDRVVVPRRIKHNFADQTCFYFRSFVEQKMVYLNDLFDRPCMNDIYDFVRRGFYFELSKYATINMLC